MVYDEEISDDDEDIMNKLHKKKKSGTGARVSQKKTVILDSDSDG